MLFYHQLHQIKVISSYLQMLCLTQLTFHPMLIFGDGSW